MGNINGVTFMETAPLVFSRLDELNRRSKSRPEEISTKDKLKSAAGFVGNYFDRRVQQHMYNFLMHFLLFLFPCEL
jgi:hypothetical protein